MLLRKGDDGEVLAEKIDLNKAMKNENTHVNEHDPLVHPLDIIYVPRTSIASASKFMQMVYDGFLQPVDLYLRWLWWTKWD
jgi:hypothetical protein